MMPFVDKLIFSWDISLTMIENPPLKRLEKTVHKNKMIASMKRKPKIRYTINKNDNIHKNEDQDIRRSDEY